MYKLSCQSYDIHINNWEALNTFVNQRTYSNVVVIVDEHTTEHCLPVFASNFETKFDIIEIESGEINKTLETCQGIWASMMDFGMDRHALCINLGGGVIGDMGGFCASTYMRGMDFIQIPTTLLSQVDASVGGKLGIDFDQYKNLIGIIKDPQGVYIFTDFLNTLSYQERRSGFAEIIKHDLIADAKNYQTLKNIVLSSFDKWEDLIYRSVDIKRQVVLDDPTEKSSRKILNFGHTIGHAIESINLGTNNHLLHGEAIAIGMIVETHLSVLKGFITLEQSSEIKKAIINIYGHHPEVIPTTTNIVDVMRHDKKNRGGRILFSLLEDIGKGNYDQEVTDDDIAQCIDWYKRKF